MVADSDLKAVVEGERLLFAVALDSRGAVVAKAGEIPRSETSALVSGLLGPYGNPRDTFESLEGQMLPRIWSQGEELAYIDKPSPDIVVVMFDSSSNLDEAEGPVEEATALGNRSRQVASFLRSRLGAPPLE